MQTQTLIRIIRGLTLPEPDWNDGEFSEGYAEGYQAAIDDIVSHLELNDKAHQRARDKFFRNVYSNGTPISLKGAKD